MQNPQIIECNKNTWTLVASSVNRAFITINKWVETIDKRRESSLSYWATYRLAGGAPPPVGNHNEGDNVGKDGINFSTPEYPIDIYIYCTGNNGSIKVSFLVGEEPPPVQNAFLKESDIEGTQVGNITLKPYSLAGGGGSSFSPTLLEASADGIFYILTFEKTLRIIKQRALGHIQLVSTTDFSSIITGSVKDMVLEGDDLFILDFHDKLYKFNVLDPIAPYYVTTFTDPDIHDSGSITIMGSNILLTGNDTAGKGRLFIIDRQNMILVAPYFESATFGDLCIKIIAQGSYVLCLTRKPAPVNAYFELLHIISPTQIIENPSSKIEIPIDENDVYNMRVQNETAFVCGINKVVYIDFIRKTNLQIAGIFESTYASHIHDIAPFGRYMGVISYDNSLIFTVDNTSLSSPQIVDNYVQNIQKLNGAQKIVVYENTYFVIASTAQSYSSWDLNGYNFAPIDADCIHSDSDILAEQDIKAGNDIKARGHIYGQDIFVPRLAPANSFAFLHSTGQTTTSQRQYLYRRLDIPKLFVVEENERQFDIALEVEFQLGQRYLGELDTVFNISLLLKGINLNAPGPTDYNFSFGLAKGTTNSYRISSISADSNYMTVVTTEPHGLESQEFVIIDGTTGALLDEADQITVVDANTFTTATPLTGTDNQGRFAKVLTNYEYIPFLGVEKQVLLDDQILLKKNDFIFPVIAPLFQPLHDWYLTAISSKISRAF
jgi:hypothetical protein